MEIETIKQGNAMVVKAKGRLDAAASTLFEQQCNHLLDQGVTQIIADLGGVDQISSAGLRSILVISKRAAEKGGKLLLYNLGGAVKEVFDLSGFASWKLENGEWVEKS
ncbi:MAG TPA: anti-sigma factor antagonist [Verrucomicrobia bacterium]|nr:MAG: hypothetical protein A2X46_15245 [Lentisphaerae bacterium GWF2_57_35]HBA83271.1 anti-sigma factor antagonist [Verrucomicrobiota bacterium]